MDSKLKLTVLGCGSASGSPTIACSCVVCHSGKEKNQRLRTSALIEALGRKIIIDTGPDFRFQMLKNKITTIDGVFYTHPHSDHINGIDDLRAFFFSSRKSIDIFGSQFTLDNMMQSFSYAFSTKDVYWNQPMLNPQSVLLATVNNIKGIPFYVNELPHGIWNTTVFRVGNIAWLTDIHEVTDDMIEQLRGLDYLFIDCLRDEKTPSHLDFESSIKYAKIIGAKQTYLIHLSHSYDYDELLARCPKGIEPAYDGLEVISTFK